MTQLYTLGYARLTPPDLLRIAAGLNAIIFDVREKPVSRKPGFGGNQLAALLGPRYQKHGHHLGGRGNVTQDGIDAIDDALDAGNNVILLCLEEAPGDCHRHHDIAGPLFPEALHIYRNEIFTAGDLTQAIADDADYPIIEWLTDLIASTQPAQAAKINP